ncbi:Major facilitator superfamily domaingeneral substrate transporter [Penicillium diatomitis]|uniref:Major facilitator superfamily domaingeneral substrate transporter n=1 Tax=Penicillium diatomitis TaxID=2819901 RepID=A0A9X0BJB8_9EURO|nr:Major facilitator superfamily domaingeneral substrate transporter [Penicillium diatomitis]KAJ5469400.1 Major facilitator superfamily domaingeneral substrate transporter [Penicillium diatomitis]
MQQEPDHHDRRASGRSRVMTALTHALDELGLVTMYQSPRDVKFLCAQRFVRLFAYGGSTLILASYLSAIGVTDDRIGLFMTLTLVGDVVISFFLTLFADAMGRKAVLALGSALMAGSGVVFAMSGNYWVLLAAAVFGVISPSGNEIGPFRAVEESTLAHLSPKEKLPDIFAWYSLLGTAGTALGQLICGWLISSLQALHGWTFIPSCRVIFFVYAGVGLIKLVLTLALTHKVETEDKQRAREQRPTGETQPLLADASPAAQESSSPKNGKKSLFSSVEKDLWSLIIRLFILFGIDSFASGLASLSWMTYFFHRKFSLPEGELGTIFFVTSSISAASMLIASSIAKRIGNVKTMVFTHLPSAICLALISVPNSLPLALTFLVLRACSQNMDVAPRSAFLAAALPADKRTAIMGAVNVVKTTSQSLGPLLTGILARHNRFGVSFIIAGCLKVTYDLGMLASFAGKEAEARKQAAREETGDEEEEIR